MKKLILITMSVLLMVGCASILTKAPRQVLAEAGNIFAATDFIYTHIPSHGAIGDGMAIAAQGGANASRLRDVLENLSKSGNGKILVSGSNSSLVNAVIKGAVDSRTFPGVWLIYAGDEKYAASLKKTVEDSDIKYSFIDIHER